MKSSAVLAAGALAVLATLAILLWPESDPADPADPVAASAAHPTAATVARRTCAQRIERATPPPRNLRLGPLSFLNLEAFADRRFLDKFPDGRGGYRLKAPVSVRAGKVVSLSIAPEHRANATLSYGATRDYRSVSSDVVRLHACDRDEPRLGGRRGTVGPWTAFSGGFELTGRGCVTLEARVRGSARLYRKTVSFGMGDTCGRPPAPRRLAVRTCADAVRFGAAPDAVLGPVGFLFVSDYADPAGVADLRDPGSGLYWFKSPALVRSRKVVTVSIAPEDRAGADLKFAFDARGQWAPSDVVRFSPCVDRLETAWPGGFLLEKPGCVTILAREQGSGRAYRRTIGFGVGSACEGKR